MSKKLIKEVSIVNEGKIIEGDLLIENERIAKIGSNIQVDGAVEEFDGKGKWLIPGIIDDQVHFREPGLTHKAEIYTEAKAAVAGGTTTFMEMPNTKPPALTQAKLQEKYDRANAVSMANYSFFMGVSNENYDEVMRTNCKNTCGIKIFMGSSTGNMLVDEATVLEKIFANAPCLIATHCEDEQTIRDNEALYRDRYGEDLWIAFHPIIRNEEACLKSSKFASELAKKHNTRLHILHISTEDELHLFRNDIPLKEKRITSEVCVHHLYFDASDYYILTTQVKCNPAIKEKRHKKALFEALLDDRLDIIATDHAPHTRAEKMNSYFKAPSGLPLVQHSLNVMLDFYHKGMISPERIVEKMCHAPADCFEIAERGYIREGYKADLVLVDPNKDLKVQYDNILYKCGWSPFLGKNFKGAVTHTFVNGHLAYKNGSFDESQKGQRILFDRD